MSEKRKIIFRLEQDGYGYPPTNFESLWAVSLQNGNYRLDNIPFYAFDVSAGDEVKVNQVDDELFFQSLVKPSKNSTFRLFLLNPKESETVRGYLKTLGCISEFNQLAGLIAVGIPKNVRISPFLDYIAKAKELGDIDFDEGALRHEVD